MALRTTSPPKRPTSRTRFDGSGDDDPEEDKALRGDFDVVRVLARIIDLQPSFARRDIEGIDARSGQHSPSDSAMNAARPLLLRDTFYGVHCRASSIGPVSMHCAPETAIEVSSTYPS